MFWSTHARWRHQLSAYLDGQLSDGPRRRLEEHLSACPGCQTELRDIQAAKAALGSLPLQEVPRSFALRPEQVEARARPAGLRGPVLATRLAGTALAAALAIILVVDLAEPAGGGPDMPLQEATPTRVEQQKESPLAPTEAPTPGQESAGTDQTAPAPTTPPAVPAEGGLDPLRAAEIALAAALGAAVLASAAFTLARRSRRMSGRAA